ncbi:MAG: DUF72 domain-containing protein [Methanothrix sp.]
MKEAQVTPVSFGGIMHAAFGFAARCARKEIDPEALEALRERNVANVLMDGPGHHVGTEQTADHAYVRFHGRNYDIWYKGEEKDDHRLNRYDYLYRKEQLESWVPRINEAASACPRLYGGRGQSCDPADGIIKAEIRLFWPYLELDFDQHAVLLEELF